MIDDLSRLVDAILGSLTAEQWDAWRGWLTTIGGLIALSIATSTYRRNVRNKREEQARLVYSKKIHIKQIAPGEYFDTLPHGSRIGTGSPGMTYVPNPNSEAKPRMLGFASQHLLQATVVIHNGSKELIAPAKVQLVNGARIPKPWEQIAILAETVEPESDYIGTFHWVAESPNSIPGLLTTLIFRDASGQWWRRHQSEPIERVHDDPENGGMTRQERNAAREHQQRIGVPATDRLREPRVGLRVWLHRLARRAVGKRPLP